VTLNGQTATVTAPAGAFPTASSVSITLYAAGSVPRAVQSAQRQVRSLPTGSSAIAEVTLNATVAPVKPLKISVTEVSAATGSVVRLAGYGTNGFADVDTTTVTNGTATEDDNAATTYPGASLAANTNYAFYSIAQGSAAAPPTPVIAPTVPAAIPVASSATIGVSETDGNGFPILTGTPAFALDTPALGTIVATTGVFTAGASDASGNVIVTDTASGHGNASGKAAIKVGGSPRPAGNGDTFTFSGTLTQTLSDNLLPGSTAPVTSTQTDQVTQTITSSGTTDGTTYTLTTNEQDASALSTVTVNTVTSLAYQTAASGYVVRVTKSVANDSNGVTYETDYGPNNGELTKVPEGAGTFNNDAQLTYTENDPGNPGYDSSGNPNQPTTTRQQNADGSYTQVTWSNGFPEQYFDHVDGTGSALVYNNGTVEYDFTAPVAGSPAYLPITISSVSSSGTKTQTGTAQAYAWYGTSVPPLASDTTTITTGSQLDASCTKYGTNATATLVSEQLQSLDIALGQTETRTTKTYDVAGAGTVCVVLSDTVSTYYDYSGQEGAYIQKRPTGATPFEATTVQETLSLQNATTIASVRRAASAVSAPPVTVLGALRARFDHVVQQARFREAQRRASLLQSAKGAR